MAKKTAVLILHFRDNQETVPCLDSLLKATETPFTTYVICVQCKDTKVIENHPIKPRLIIESKNGGFAWANNVMMRQAVKDGFNYLVMLNNDTTVDPHFLAPLIRQLSQPMVGFVGPKMYFYPGKEFHHDDYQENERGKVIWYMGALIDWANVRGFHWGVNEVDHGQFATAADTDIATGCCIALTKATLATIGYMNEKYFLYYEDADWSLELRRHGLKIVVEPHSIIWHKNAGSTGGSGSPLQMYYQTRNRFYFGMKFAPFRTKTHLVINAFKDLKHFDPARRQAARDGLLFRLGIQPLPVTPVH